MIKDTAGCPKVFTSVALPFGATQSIYAFNRLTRRSLLISNTESRISDLVQEISGIMEWQRS